MIHGTCEATNWIVGRGFVRMAEFERMKFPFRQHYHVPDHIGYMIPVSMEIAAALDMPWEKQRVVRACCAIHDWVQNFNSAGVMSFDGRGVLQRQRKRGPNEDESGDILVMHMREANRWFGGSTFTEMDMQEGDMAVKWTYPEWVPDAGTFNHPRLREYYRQNGYLPEVCASVVWADLADVGRDPVHAAEFARREYLELAVGIWQELVEAKHQSDFLPERRTQIRDHALVFFGNQEKFIAGRKQFMAEEIDMLPAAKRDKVHALFSAWEACKAHAKAEYNRLSKLEFFDLLWALGFNPIPVD